MLGNLRTWVRENKPKAILFGVIGLIVFGFLNFELIHFSSSPPFCRMACHNMVLEVDQWAKSSHGKRHIDCVSCHYREGLVGYMTAKVLAMKDLVNSITGQMGLEMHDPHEQEELEHHYEWPAPGTLVLTPDLIESEKKMDHIILPQYIHNVEVDLGMGPCKKVDEHGNYRIQLHRHSYLWNNVEMNCRGCHSKLGNRGRHSKKNIADFVIKNALMSFKGQSEKRRKGIIVPHAIHLDKGIACIDCHAEIVHGPDEFREENGAVMPRMEICFRCHNDRRAPRDCTLCHEMQKKMNLGIEGAGVEDTPNYMYPNSATCTDCHLQENQWKMSPKVCSDCHGDEGHGATMIEWQTSTKELLTQVEPLVDEVGKGIEQAKQRGKNVGAAEELYNDALYNYEFVVSDGSKGAHNVDYAAALLNSAKEKLQNASERLIE
ncbi:MAG: NapC/NirT family cytochrome c [Candidatus Schekmanbacteria bacterium]|nr:NapC/NirT family cytochrome c [Candidatus Schekmanbacteria bacterium]